MRITMSVENPTGDFQDRLLALLAEHAAQVEIDTTWTVERAMRYYRSLPLRARRIIAETVTRGGHVPADALRDNKDTSLRGHSGALKRKLTQGVLRGWWPEAIEPPITADGPGFGKVVGYTMPEHLLPIFRDAINRIATEQ